MKRALVLFLSVLYVLLSSGFSAYTHLCEGVAQEVNLFSSSAKTGSCPICVAKKHGKTPKKNCCKHQAKLIKLSEKAQKLTVKNYIAKVWGEVIPNRTLGAVFDAPIGLAAQYTTFSNTYPIPGNPLYILHCVYRI